MAQSLPDQSETTLRDRFRSTLRRNQVTFRSRFPIYRRQAQAFEDGLLDELEADAIADVLSRKRREESRS